MWAGHVKGRRWSGHRIGQEKVHLGGEGGVCGGVLEGQRYGSVPGKLGKALGRA